MPLQLNCRIQPPPTAAPVLSWWASVSGLGGGSGLKETSNGWSVKPENADWSGDSGSRVEVVGDARPEQVGHPQGTIQRYPPGS